MSSKAKDSVMRSTLAVTLIILASKGMGFIRDIISAGYFATGMERDAYTSAYSLFYLPVLLFNSCITSTLIPLYVDARQNDSRLGADRFASNCINLFFAFSLGIAVLMYFLAEPLVRLVYIGFDPGKAHLTADLTRIMLLSLVFVVTSIVLASVLNAQERFLPAQLTGFPLSAAVIIATVFFSRRYGIRAVAWGVFFAGIGQVLILLPWCRRDLKWSPHLSLKDPRIQQMLKLAVPAVLAMAVNELNHLIDKSIASGLNTGDISALDYAYRLIQFATGVLAVPLTTVMFSRIARKSAEHDRSGIMEILQNCIEVMPMVMVPFTVAGGVLAEDIIRLVYMHGRFGMDSLRVTSSVFLFYIVGILGFSMRDIFNRAFHAMQDTRTPMRVACLTVVLNIALNLILSRVMGANGLALATSVSCAAGAVILFALLRRRLGRMGLQRSLRELSKIAAAAVVCLILAFVLNRLVPPAAGKGSALLRIVLIVFASFAGYLAALAALKARQLAFLKKTLLRR